METIVDSKTTPPGRPMPIMPRPAAYGSYDAELRVAAVEQAMRMWPSGISDADRVVEAAGKIYAFLKE